MTTGNIVHNRLMGKIEYGRDINCFSTVVENDYLKSK